jgi:hypothetical protein
MNIAKAVKVIPQSRFPPGFCSSLSRLLIEALIPGLAVRVKVGFLANANHAYAKAVTDVDIVKSSSVEAAAVVPDC